MAKAPLTINSEFTVKEEKVLNYILCILCFALFMYGLSDAINKHFVKIDYQSYFFAAAIFPAILFFNKARSKRVFIRVNKTGIYQDEKLVTGWADFLKAYLAQDKKSGLKAASIQDKFVLMVEHRKAGDPRTGLRRKIPLGNTQNKSEEDVLAAVHFFSTIYRQSNPPVTKGYPLR